MHAALVSPTVLPAPTDASVAPIEALLDDPAEWPAFGQPLDEAGRWRSQVGVEGMHCATCAFTLESALQAVPGVELVEVNAASRRASVVWRAGQALPSQWFAAARAAGYRLSPLGDEGARARRLREGRHALWRWLVAGLCMMQVMMYAVPGYIAQPGDITPDMVQLLRWASWVLSLPVVLFACGPFFRGAWRDLRHGRIGMDTPVALGIAITFAVSSAATFDASGLFGHEVYFDSLTMFVFFLLTGRWLEQKLRERTAGALEAVLARLPDSVERQRPDGRFEPVAVRRLRVGDVLRVRPGEAFPADGTLIEGDTDADEALLTGESRAVPKRSGDAVYAGSFNLSATVCLRVQRLGAQTRFGEILALMESAALRKPRLARLADRVARPFLAAVLLAALGAALWWWPHDPGHALMVAAAVLIVTCPCALSLATPAAMLASAGALAQRGVLAVRLQGLESLAGIDTVIFDKTGTLTQGLPVLERVYSRRGVPPGDALAMAAALARHSLHPVARALLQTQATRGTAVDWVASEAVEQVGQGVQARLSPARTSRPASRAMRLGSADFCGAAALDHAGMQVHLADEAGWLASFALAEALRPDAAAAVAALRQAGVDVQLLSGDRNRAVQAVAQAAGIAQARAECTPQDKLAHVQQLQAGGHRVAMVGDGLNDGPVIARADVSFAFGRAVPLAQARADFIVLSDAVGAVGQTLAQARATMRIVRQNLAWAAGYNALCVPLALLGWLPAWLAGLGMAASSLVVVVNAARLGRPGRTGPADAVRHPPAADFSLQPT